MSDHKKAVNSTFQDSLKQLHSLLTLAGTVEDPPSYMLSDISSSAF